MIKIDELKTAGCNEIVDLDDYESSCISGGLKEGSLSQFSEFSQSFNFIMFASADIQASVAQALNKK